MEVTEERKLVDKLGSNWKIRRSSYEDGPPHRTIFLKKRDLEVNSLSFCERIFFWDALHWEEVAWSTKPNEIRTYNENIAKELDSLDLLSKVILV